MADKATSKMPVLQAASLEFHVDPSEAAVRFLTHLRNLVRSGLPVKFTVEVGSGEAGDPK